jgi:transposase
MVSVIIIVFNKFRIKTNKDIEGKPLRFCGSARFLWNKSLAMNLERLENSQAILWYNELAFWLTLWKQSDEYAFLRECPSQVLQQKLRDLDRAFRDSFDKKQPLKHIPVFKKRGSGDGRLSYTLYLKDLSGKIVKMIKSSKERCGTGSTNIVRY